MRGRAEDNSQGWLPVPALRSSAHRSQILTFEFASRQRGLSHPSPNMQQGLSLCEPSANADRVNFVS